MSKQSKIMSPAHKKLGSNLSRFMGICLGNMAIVALILLIKDFLVETDQPIKHSSQKSFVLTDYINSAMSRAVFRDLRNGKVYAAIPGIGAALGHGIDEATARLDLRRSLEFVILTAVFDHSPLPSFDDNSLVLMEEYKGETAKIYPEAEDALKNQDPLSEFASTEE